jgi:16S rRNA (guanine527-N7)-methyltransferase
MTQPEQNRRAWASQLEELAARFHLNDAAMGRLEVLVRVLAGDPLAPTTIRDPAQVLDDHLADSLVALELEEMRAASSIVDLGSGAGIPGLPLAIALPHTTFVLVESAARKCAFIERAAGATGITNVGVVHARAESWGDGLGRFEMATARALARLDVVVEYAAPLLRPGGTLVAWRGQRDPEAEAAGARAAALLGLEPVDVLAVQPYPAARNRHLTLMRKVKETPAGFPRRAGMASKRPLGSSSPSRRAPSDRARR